VSGDLGDMGFGEWKFLVRPRGKAPVVGLEDEAPQAETI